MKRTTRGPKCDPPYKEAEAVTRVLFISQRTTRFYSGRIRTRHRLWCVPKFRVSLLLNVDANETTKVGANLRCRVYSVPCVHRETFTAHPDPPSDGSSASHLQRTQSVISPAPWATRRRPKKAIRPKMVGPHVRHLFTAVHFEVSYVTQSSSFFCMTHGISVV